MLYHFLDTYCESPECDCVQEPNILQYSQSFKGPQQSEFTAIYNQIGYGGIVSLLGCNDIKLDIDYLVGDNCDDCDTEVDLTVQTISLYIPKNSSFEIPDGFYNRINYTILNDAGVPANLTAGKDFSINIYSFFN